VLEKINAKIQDASTISTLVGKWKTQGLKIVFTNGCFDLLHYGHVHYLAEAKALGDKLIVGLNSDQSVQGLKGIHRPIKEEKSRQFILASLECVDAVMLFEEDTPLRLVQLIRPNIIVKGGDWQAKDIVGSDIVLADGGKVKSLPFIEGFSTTKLEQKIKDQKNGSN